MGQVCVTIITKIPARLKIRLTGGARKNPLQNANWSVLIPLDWSWTDNKRGSSDGTKVLCVTGST